MEQNVPKLRTAYFFRARDSESPDEVVEHLAALGCENITLYVGPDGRVRGSGVKEAP